MQKIAVVSKDLLPQIIISPNADPAIIHAAEECKYFVEKITQFALSIKSEIPIEDKSYIFISKSTSLDAYLAENNVELVLDECELGQEGSIIRILAPTSSLAIVGLTPRSVLYGVYSLFSDIWGVHWYTPDVESYPECKLLELDSHFNYVSKPKFEFRMVLDVEAQDPDFASRNRLNLSLFAEEIHGGRLVDSGKMTHTLYSLVPPSIYFKDHPEYFSLLPVRQQKQSQDDAYTLEDGVVMSDANIDKTRQASGDGLWGSVGQLCFTNPDVLEIVVEKILKWHEEQPNVIGFAVAQNDASSGYCQCSDCMALNQSRGAYSGSVIEFVNKVAELVNALIPNLFIFTIAYTYTEAPPMNIKVHDHVVVILCHMRPSCDSHPLAKCPANARFIRHLQGWQKIAKNVVIWHYVVNFSHYLLPFPNIYALSQDVKWYYDQGVKGALFQAVSTPTKSAEFQEMKSWVLMQMSWNPTQNLWTLVEEFVNSYYGPAAPVLMQWLHFLNEQVQRDTTKCMHLYAGMETGILNKIVLDEGWRLFTDALNLVGSKHQFYERVEKLTVGLYYAELRMPINYILKDGKIQAEDKEKRQHFLDKFQEICGKYKITAIAEGGGYKAFIEMVKAQLKPLEYTVILEVMRQHVLFSSLELFWKWAKGQETSDHYVDLQNIPPLKGTGIDARSWVDYLKLIGILERQSGIELGGKINWNKIRDAGWIR